MAYKESNILDRSNAEDQGSDTQTLQFNSDTVILPHESYVRDADLSRDGSDLVMDGPQGTLVIEDYYAGLESPTLIGPSGASLTPELVNSFTSSGNEYAQSHSMNDASPVGAVDEISGNATITRLDGSQEKLTMGTPVFQGDVIETDADAAVNVAFIDDSSFAVSEETRLAIDEYVFDPSSQGGVQNFSVLKGVFVYTSGLIGREDPDDVTIDTPVGSIGIRGTIIAGDVDNAEITVIEGAIVLRDTGGNEMTLASQFETGKFLSEGRGIINLGQKSAGEVAENFSKVSGVAPELFSSINDAALENAGATQEPAQDGDQAPLDSKPAVVEEGQEFDANGATDKNGDSEVDGTVDEAPADTESKGAESEDAKEASTEEASEGEGEATVQVVEDPLGLSPEVLPNNSLGSTQTVTATVATQTLNSSNNGNGNSGKGNAQKRGLLKQLEEDQSTLDDNTNYSANGDDDAAGNQAPHALNFKDINVFRAVTDGSSGTTLEIDASELFNDPDGDDLTYSLSSTSASTLSALVSAGTAVTSQSNEDFSGSDVLTLTFATTPADTEFNLVFTAHEDGTSNVASSGFTVLTGSSTIAAGSSSEVFVSLQGISQTNTVQKDGVVIYKVDIGGGPSAYTEIQSNDVIFNGSNGLDAVTISTDAGSGNRIFAHEGDDIINLNNDQTDLAVYGGEGNDTINLSDDFIAGLTAGANIRINGGDDDSALGDRINISGLANVDFTNIDLGNTNHIENIETIVVDNGQSQTVTLRFEDVLRMTDGDNELYINADSGDTINFDAQGFQRTSNTTDGTNDTHVFNDGTNTVTLIISTDATDSVTNFVV